MTINPKRGEIWLVNLDPTVGAEIKKTRPALVISSDFIGKLGTLTTSDLQELTAAIVGIIEHQETRDS
jgi:mRNA interferase MazF